MSKAQELVPELSPCPFCGAGETRISQNGRIWNGMKYGEPSSVSVIHHCTPVDGQPSTLLERVGRDYESAVDAWNRRPASSEQQAAQQHADTISLPRKEWEELQYYLGRCYDKGHLDQCFDLVEPLEALNAAIAVRASNGGKA